MEPSFTRISANDPSAAFVTVFSEGPTTNGPTSLIAAAVLPAWRWRSRCGRGWARSFTVTGGRPGAWRQSHERPRASAIVAAARRLFETIDVWQSVAGDAQPILDMVVTDSPSTTRCARSSSLSRGDVEPGEPFAHMVENRHLIDALVAKASEVGIGLRRGGEIRRSPARERVRRTVPHSGGLADGGDVSARLLVAADGARSRIRERPVSPCMAGTTVSRRS